MINKEQKMENAMEENNKFFEKTLKETVREFNVNPSDKAWIISSSSSNEIYSGLSNLDILKNTFKNDWENCEKHEMDEYSIQKVFNYRLQMIGYINVDEIDEEFHISVRHLQSKEKDIIKEFVESLKKSKEYIKTDEKKFHILETSTNFNESFTYQEIVYGGLK
jgi:hypothetical protein